MASSSALLSALLCALAGERPVVVAIVDDAFDPRSAPARAFWTDSVSQAGGNPAQPRPRDLADRDGDVSPPSARQTEFRHGTAAANLMASRLLAYLGKDAARSVRFLPLKVLSDDAPRPVMTLGYAGIEHAARERADVILCAWSGGIPGPEHREMVAQALGRGALVVASAGNEATRRPAFPASLPGVLAVAAVDSLGRRETLSSRGDWVSLCAPGDSLGVSVFPLAGGTAAFGRTSRAATEAAALAVALKVRHPGWTADKIRQVLMASSAPLEPSDPGLSGTLGAGRIDPVRAFLGDWESPRVDSREIHPAGILELGRRPWKVSLEGPGSYRGLQLRVSGQGKAQGAIEVSPQGGPKSRYRLRDLSQGVEIPGTAWELSWAGAGKPSGILEFRKLELDSSRLFCRETKELWGDSGKGSDGSGPHDYAHESDCRWSIRVEAGRRIRLEFDSFHTDPKDQLHVFHGSSTLQENLLALFAGPKLPPVLVSPRNELLLWFPSSRTGLGKGFSFRWQAVSDTVAPGVVLPDPQLRP